LADEGFQRELEREALYDKLSVLAHGERTRTTLDLGSIVVAQDGERVVLDADGLVVVVGPAKGAMTSCRRSFEKTSSIVSVTRSDLPVVYWTVLTAAAA
jgi:hypothetical protein